MRKYEIIVAIISLLSLAYAVQAQYWFQSGANGGFNSQGNNGGSITIQTISPQQETIGSLAYWIGESLSNGAFIQMGYEVPNVTGYAPQYCNENGCNGSVYYQKGVPTWFWEYFRAGGSNSNFYGEVGPDGSVGGNNTYHTYAFNSSGSFWTFWFDGQNVGSINLGSGTSGANPLLAIGEYADTNGNNYYMPNVIFKDMAAYDGSYYKPISQAYSLINYGKGSLQSLSNPYGVKEVGDFVNNFMVGSGLPTVSQILLWSQGFNLNVKSDYGANGTETYLAYTQVQLSMPMYVNISNGVRAEFSGWRGTGSGSYTGKSNVTSIYMGSNVTETALWTTQYYINASSQYGIVDGAGWADKGSNVTLSLNSNIIGVAPGKRAVFSGWSTGARQKSTVINAYGPLTITTDWIIQFLVNATTTYGHINGVGWYRANTTATISPSILTINATPKQRVEFEGWSDGINQSTRELVVDAPLFLSAIYATQYFVTLSARDAYNRSISASYFNVDGNNMTGGFFAFQDRTYSINYAYYKDVVVTAHTTITNVSYSQTRVVQLPVYNVTVRATGIFDIPLNASLNITFKNNTHVTTSLGSNGTLIIPDVPYGYAYGYDSFLGERQGVSLSNGGIASSSFVTPSIVGAIFAAIIAIFIIEVLYFREREKPIHIMGQAKAQRPGGKGRR